MSAIRTTQPAAYMPRRDLTRLSEGRIVYIRSEPSSEYDLPLYAERLMVCVCCNKVAGPSREDVAMMLEDIDLSPSERRIFTELWLHRAKDYVAHTRIVWVLYGDDPNGGPDNPMKVIRVHVSKMRRKLKSFGFVIELHFGLGYRLLLRQPETV